MHPYGEQLGSVPFDAPVVERGVGFFETVLLIGRRPVLWVPHVDRLLSSLAQLALPAPARGELATAAARAVGVLPADAPDERALRLSWIALHAELDTPGSWRLDVSVRPIPALTRQRRASAHAVTLPMELGRDSPALKSTSYLAAVLGLRHAQRQGGNEGLFLAHDGTYIEGTSTAVLAWDGGRLLQSPHAALPSVTAAAFLDGEPRRGVLSAEHLAAGAILLGSLTGAVPLLRLDGRPCEAPAAMLERIEAFNRRQAAGASTLPAA